MGIERLANSLLLDAKKEADEIVKAAEQQAEKALSEEKERRGRLAAEAEHEVELTTQEHRRERLAWARLEAKRVVAEAKEDAISASFDAMYDSLGELRKGSEYKAFMKKAVGRAIDALGTKEAVVHCLKGEKAVFAEGRAKVVEDLDALGGALVETPDRKVRVDLTLEALLELSREPLRKQAYKALFGEEKREKKK